MQHGAHVARRWKRRLLWAALLVSSLLAVLAPAGPAPAAEAVYFDDVLPNHPYYDPINGLFVAGVIDGYDTPQGGKEFRPGIGIKRAQFAKMILGVLAIPVAESEWQDSSRPFTDFDSDDPGNLYPHDYVAAAFRLGITTGKTATTFEPYVDISRIQVVSMVVRAAKANKPGALTDPPSGWSGFLSSYYSDPNHGQNVRIAEYNGLLAGLLGFGSSWNADLKATRGEAAQIMWNLYMIEDSGLLYFDDFSDPRSGWEVNYEQDTYKCGYLAREQYYSIELFTPDYWAYSRHPKVYTDFSVEVDACSVYGSIAGGYGLTFRTVDADNFYYFGISNNGRWGLYRRTPQGWQVLLAPADSSAINTGAVWNHLQVICEGTSIAVYVNDVLLGSTMDGSLTSGRIGLLGESVDTGGVQMVFDNLAVWSADKF